MTGNVTLNSAQLVFETIGRALFFPVWWYTRGLLAVLRYAGQSIKGQYENLGLGVWLTNLFVPMYGTTDFMGRFISFFVRFFMIIARGFVLLLWTIIILLLIIFYVLLLPVSVFGVFYHLTGLFFPSFYVFA